MEFVLNKIPREKKCGYARVAIIALTIEANLLLINATVFTMCYNVSMDKNDGRFKKGEHRSPATEFKKGQHWRKHKPFWDYEWLYNEYINKKRSAGNIAREFGVDTHAILFWLRKHNIPRRNFIEAKALNPISFPREKNWMYGKKGALSPSWRGGCTPERQAFYSSEEWAEASLGVWRRDRGVCQRCHTKNKRMNIHHIISFSEKETRTDLNNLVLLCTTCHRFVHSRKNINREFIREGGDG